MRASLLTMSSLGAVLGWNVVAGIGQLSREILLSRYRVRLVMGVGVVLPMAQPLGPW